MTAAAEYARRLAGQREEQDRLVARYAVLTRVRKLFMGVFIALAILAEHEALLVKVVLLGVPLIVLELVSRRREKTGRGWQRTERLTAFYQRRLACVEDRWVGSGTPGRRYLDDEHPNAADLDLFGSGSLFERLCTARTRPGQNTLAAWLLTPAPVAEVHERQAAVAELRDRLDFRQELDVVASRVPEDDLTPLVAWGRSPLAMRSVAGRWFVTFAGFAQLAALLGWLFLGTGFLPVLAGLVVQVVLSLVLRRPIREAVGPGEEGSRTLPALAPVFALLQREQFESPRLRRLQAALIGQGGLASSGVGWLRWRFCHAAAASLVAAGPQAALGLETWRRQSGPALGRWLDALGEFEALCSLAAYAFENAADPFPVLDEATARFEATGLGHPLLPRGRCVPNDVTLGGDTRLLVVSGSNMAGKSTLLRAAGINVVLAQAGAPVRAERLRLSPLVVGGTLRVQDSLRDGRSRFYAEALRVRKLLDLAVGPIPLLFLLDELFQGTNSSDRRVGAEGVLRRLLDAGALGMATTHDLALTEIADRLRPRAANVHFSEHFENGEMTFDYRMKPGPVTQTNGLALLRSVGIDV